jgi:hypothetical protein
LFLEDVDIIGYQKNKSELLGPSLTKKQKRSFPEEGSKVVCPGQ